MLAYRSIGSICIVSFENSSNSLKLYFVYTRSVEAG